MSVPDEFAEASAGTQVLADPARVVPGAVIEQTDDDAGSAIPVPRSELQLGPEATDLPPLPRPDLPDLGPGTGFGDPRDLRLLADVQVELAVELGRVKLPLRDLLSLAPGAVLELDRSADAPVDILVNGCLVARGEVVVIDGEFGVRVTAVVER